MGTWSIDFLRNKNLLKGPVQQFELEELQGVSGLKGLRWQVIWKLKN
jgi:hypothetical protein